MLRAAWWRQTVIDPKYPYGSYGFYEADMAHKLGTPPPIGKDGVFDRLRGKMVGCSGYVPKPFVPDELVQAVGEHIGVSGPLRK